MTRNLRSGFALEEPRRRKVLQRDLELPRRRWSNRRHHEYQDYHGRKVWRGGGQLPHHHRQRRIGEGVCRSQVQGPYPVSPSLPLSRFWYYSLCIGFGIIGIGIIGLVLVS